ncbi:hypothetical protein DERP_013619 [Dermatophagoides pteronyssinus]|uniref:Uncharacterized protein n=1 Tax=Dermatophagoides pteronyssinus TaxID=6956 RepID=A0ABQ8IQA9_DERPT|nr:hypothetical protein DERP_013616 [Dermatophagoides pteronyssinus]KAH9412377.1 hypothetical protein DERP_013619 [Dermatophagoides pteronyssinus]
MSALAELESSPLVGSSIQIKLGIRTDVSSKPKAKRLHLIPEEFSWRSLRVNLLKWNSVVSLSRVLDRPLRTFKSEVFPAPDGPINAFRVPKRN